MKDIDEIRRENLRRLEAELGGSSEAAQVIGMAPAQFINLRSGARDSKTGKPRGMRKETARRIERAAGKPVGWLDIDHSAAGSELPPPAHAVISAPLLARVIREVQREFTRNNYVPSDSQLAAAIAHVYAKASEGRQLDRVPPVVGELIEKITKGELVVPKGG